jgi:hypothetical protein
LGEVLGDGRRDDGGDDRRNVRGDDRRVDRDDDSDRLERRDERCVRELGGDSQPDDRSLDE